MPTTTVLAEPASNEIMLPSEAAVCLNCGADRTGEYCHDCGQHFFEDGRLTIRGVWREFVARFLRLERGLLNTARHLTWRPGLMISAYIAGQRKRFSNPFGYLFFGTALALLVMNFYTDEMRDWMEAMMQQSAEDLNNPFFTEDQAQRVAEISLKMSAYSAYLYLLMCVPFTFVARVLFWNGGRNLAEIFVFALFCTGHVMLVDAVLDLPLLFGEISMQTQMWKSYGLFLAVFGWAAYDYFPGKWAATLKTLVAMVVAYMGFAIVQTIAVVAYVVATSH